MDDLKEIKESLLRVEADLHEIKRGVYGDPINKVKGLIDLNERVQLLEDSKKKIIWSLAAAGVIIELFIHLISSFNIFK